MKILKNTSTGILAAVSALLLITSSQAAERDWDQYLQRSLGPFSGQTSVLTLSAKTLETARASRELTPLLNIAQRHWDNLSPDTQALVAPWLARPTDSSNAWESKWRYKAGDTIAEYDTAHFRVHYVIATTEVYTGSESPLATTEFAAVVGGVLEEVYVREHTELGYQSLPTDGKLGGDERFDVYLVELRSRGLYGYVVSEGAASDPQRPYAAYSYMVLDNDFVNYGYTDATLPLKVTAAHEYFHAVQNGYSYQEDAAFMEQSATWMEDIVYPTIHDNYAYIGEPYEDVNGDGQYTSDLNGDGVSDDREPVLVDHNGNRVRDDGSQDWPELSLDAFDDVPVIQYGRFLWVRYLGERFGNDVVKSVWENAGSSSVSTFTSVDTILRTQNSSLSLAYQEYATWAYDKAKFSDGENYPLVWVDRTVSGINLDIASNDSPSLGNLRVSNSYSPHLHLSTIYTQILEPSGLYKFTVTNGAAALTMLVDTGSGVLTHEDVTLEGNVGYWQASAGTLKVIAVVSNIHASKNGMDWTLASTDKVDPPSKSKQDDRLMGLALFADPRRFPGAIFLCALIGLLVYRRRYPVRADNV